MQVFINKNGQQLGPFEEQQVAEMLRNGQLSPNDSGFKQGQQQWQPLSTMFSNAGTAANLAGSSLHGHQPTVP